MSRGIVNPKEKIDPEQVLKLAKFGLTTKEMSHFFLCAEDTLEKHFMDEMVQGRTEMKIGLRRAQLQLALEGKNPAMLIWLGKQHLGQQETLAREVKKEDQPDFNSLRLPGEENPALPEADYTVIPGTSIVVETPVQRKK
jgi:hypothetical protein